MNPYQVLNVPVHASEDEIKSAYRQLVKQYHPDKNSSASAKVIIVRVNEAYEILSDPARRARYDQDIVMQYEAEEQEDSVEQYKRAYKLRKRQEAIQRKEQEERLAQSAFKLMRRVTIPILMFAIALIVDQFIPGNYHEGIANSGWQERSGHARGTRGTLGSYMRIDNLIINVPHEVHLNYDYYNKPGLISITTSRIFNIPKMVVVNTDEHVYRFEAMRTIFSNFAHLHYLMLISSLFTVFRKEYTVVNYSLCYLPILILGFVILVMIP